MKEKSKCAKNIQTQISSFLMRSINITTTTNSTKQTESDFQRDGTNPIKEKLS